MTTESTEKKPKKPRAPKAEKPKKPSRAEKNAILKQPAPERPASIDPTEASSRYALKRKVRMFYDLQRMRLQVEGRIEPKAEGAGIQLTDFDLYALRSRAQELAEAEKRALRDIEEHLTAIGFYADVLSDKTRYRGIGPTLAGVLLAEIDWASSGTPSQVWSFSGLKPIDAHRCKKCHSVAIPNDDVDHRTFWRHKHAHKCQEVLSEDDVYSSGTSQRPEKGTKLPYNAWLRTKLVGVLGPVLLKVGSPWRKFYDDYKHRKESAGWGRSDAHRHQAAIRYMVKQLVANIWEEFRKYYKLPIRESYAAEYLQRPHHEKPARPQIARDAEADRQRMVDAEIEAAIRLADGDTVN